MPIFLNYFNKEIPYKVYLRPCIPGHAFLSKGNSIYCWTKKKEEKNKIDIYMPIISKANLLLKSGSLSFPWEKKRINSSGKMIATLR